LSADSSHDSARPGTGEKSSALDDSSVGYSSWKISYASATMPVNGFAESMSCVMPTVRTTFSAGAAGLAEVLAPAEDVAPRPRESARAAAPAAARTRGRRELRVTERVPFEASQTGTPPPRPYLNRGSGCGVPH